MIPAAPCQIAIDRAAAARLRRDNRLDAIIGAPEAEGRHLAAFALALRLDLPADAARLFLRQAPPLSTVDEVAAWVEAIPVQPATEVRQ